MVTEAEMKDFHDNRLGAVRCTLSRLGSVLCVLTTASCRTLRSGGFDSVYFKRQNLLYRTLSWSCSTPVLSRALENEILSHLCFQLLSGEYFFKLNLYIFKRSQCR